MPSCGGQAAEEGSRKMRKPLLSLVIVGALANWAAPSLAAANTQQPPSYNAPKPGAEFLSSDRAWANFSRAPNAWGAPFGWRR
jgi:hypothetical protein